MDKIQIKRIFNSGWTNFKRNSYLSFGATGVMAITLFLFIGLIALNFLTKELVSSLQEKIDVSAYFSLDAKEEQILAIKSDLESLPEIKNIDYITREKALELFKEKHKDDTLIQESLKELDENPLQASLNIKAKNSNQYAGIVKSLEKNKLASVIDKINFYENEGVISRVQAISSGLKKWGFLITIVLALIAVLVTFNIIRLTIYNQKQEIEIMRLVGASNWQVRGPYLVEGGLYGLFASIVTLAVVYPILYSVSDKISAFASSVNLFSYFTHFSYQIIPMVVLAGISLGVISSVIAIRRHLRI